MLTPPQGKSKTRTLWEMPGVAAGTPKSLKACSEIATSDFPMWWASPLHLRPCMQLCSGHSLCCKAGYDRPAGSYLGIHPCKPSLHTRGPLGPQRMLFCTTESPGEATCWRRVSILLSFSQYLLGVSLFRKDTVSPRVPYWRTGTCALLSGGVR